jgi:hypothetical protein
MTFPASAQDWAFVLAPTPPELADGALVGLADGGLDELGAGCLLSALLSAIGSQPLVEITTETSAGRRIADFQKGRLVIFATYDASSSIVL